MTHPILRSLDILRERASNGAKYYCGEHPLFDARDSELLRARIAKRKKITRPIQGDWIVLDTGEWRRCAHVWCRADDSIEGIQPSWGGGGSIYLCESGFGSFSGGLDPMIPMSRIEDSGQTRAASFWFFHHDRAGGHRGVSCHAPARVWRVIPSVEKQVSPP